MLTTATLLYNMYKNCVNLFQIPVRLTNAPNTSVINDQPIEDITLQVRLGILSSKYTWFWYTWYP